MCSEQQLRELGVSEDIRVNLAGYSLQNFLDVSVPFDPDNFLGGAHALGGADQRAYPFFSVLPEIPKEDPFPSAFGRFRKLDYLFSDDPGARNWQCGGINQPGGLRAGDEIAGRTNSVDLPSDDVLVNNVLSDFFGDVPDKTRSHHGITNENREDFQDSSYSEVSDDSGRCGFDNRARAHYAAKFQGWQDEYDEQLLFPNSPEANKAEIERVADERYKTNLRRIEAQYRQQLAIKDNEIQRYRQKSEHLTDELLAAYRQHNLDLTELFKQSVSRPINLEATAVADNSTGKNNFQGTQFGGGYVAGSVEGDQIGGTINNYGSSTEDVIRLIASLRDQAQVFPTDQKDEILDTLTDLARDLQEDEPDQGRIGRRLKKLVALGAAISTIASGSATVSGDLSDFTSNVIELTEQLGIPIEQVQLPPSDTP